MAGTAVTVPERHGGREMARTTAVVLVLLLVLASFGIAAVIYRQERDAAEGRDANLAEQTAIALETTLTQTVLDLQGGGAVVRSDASLDQRAFVAFSSAMTANRSVFAVVLATVVTQSERASFETRLGRPITSRDPLSKDKFDIAPVADTYLPVVAIAPDTPTLRALIGFDYAGDQPRGAAARDAIDAGEVRLTAPLNLAPTGEPGFVAIQPLFDPRLPTESPAERNAALVGLVGAAYTAQEVGELALALLPRGAEFSISDGQSVLFTTGETRGAMASIMVAGHQYDIVANDQASPRLWIPLVILVAGLTMAAVLALLLIRTFRTEAARTSALIALGRSERHALGLQALAGELAGKLTLDEVAHTVLARGSQLLGATGGQLAMCIENGQLALVGDHPPVTSSVSASTPEPVSGGPLLAALEQRDPLWVEATSTAVLPLGDGQHATGALAFRFPSGTPPMHETGLAATIATLTAGAIGRADQYEIEHDLAETLQRSLLPSSLARTPGVTIAARYRAGARGVSIGGDWYDVFSIDDDVIGLVVGDVVGRGTGAAAVMGQLRSALRALAVQGGSPEDVIAALDDHSLSIDDSLCSTVVFARLNRSTGVLTSSRAGHPPPLVLGMGEPRYVYEGKSPPLGARLGMPVGSRQVDIPLSPGAVVVFYTDGAIERRGERIDVGLSRFAAWAADPASDLEARLDHILAVIEEEEEGHTDDIAILAVEWHGPTN